MNQPENLERTIHVRDIDLAVQTFGESADPAVLLIGGAASSMDWWEDEFCQRLAAGPRFVIRYDTRDTGQSTSFEAGKPPYTQEDLVADAVGVLDALHLATAHIVGISMGGGIAQRIAVEHPDRLTSLTLISTSPGGPGGPANPDLPPMAEHLEAAFAEEAPTPDWSDRAAVIQSFVDAERQFSGSLPVDEARIRRIAGRAYDRTRDVAASQTNHWIIEGGEPVRPHLKQVAAPTLVLHGTEDPLFPYGHGEALANEIPNARLVPLPRMGHQMPPPEVWDIVISEILRHTATSH
ncbi:MAG: alpha/beta fold hydrolase [Micromonosporaceae bacterium]